MRIVAYDRPREKKFKWKENLNLKWFSQRRNNAIASHTKTRWKKKLILGTPSQECSSPFMCLSFSHSAKKYTHNARSHSRCAVNTVAVAFASAASFTPKMKKINHISELCLDSLGCFLRSIHSSSFFADANPPKYLILYYFVSHRFSIFNWFGPFSAPEWKFSFSNFNLADLPRSSEAAIIRMPSCIAQLHNAKFNTALNTGLIYRCRVACAAHGACAALWVFVYGRHGI